MAWVSAPTYLVHITVHAIRVHRSGVVPVSALALGLGHVKGDVLRYPDPAVEAEHQVNAVHRELHEREKVALVAPHQDGRDDRQRAIAQLAVPQRARVQANAPVLEQRLDLGNDEVALLEKVAHL